MMESRGKEHHCDVTLVCLNEEHVVTSSGFLSSVSEPLSDALRQSCDNVITCSNLPAQMWRAMLDALDKRNMGNINSYVDDSWSIKDLRIVADCLRIRPVVEMCDHILAVNDISKRLYSDGVAEVMLSIKAKMSDDVNSVIFCYHPSVPEEHQVYLQLDDYNASIDDVNVTNIIIEAKDVPDPKRVRRSDNVVTENKTVTLKAQKSMRSKGIKICLPSEMSCVEEKSRNLILAKTSSLTDADFEKDIKNSVRKVCFVCGDNCEMDQVQCRLCFLVVKGNETTHMETHHPFTESHLWPVTCNVIDFVHTKESALLGYKVFGAQQDKPEFKCNACEVLLTNSDEYITHLRTHSSKVFMCSNASCSSAFAVEACRREHLHFCKGGDILTCKICRDTIGGIVGYNKHQCKQGKNKPKQRFKSVIPNKPSFKEIQIGNVFKRIGTDYQAIENFHKCCVRCGKDCSGEQIQCLLCGQLISSSTAEIHFNQTHADMSTSLTLWPVTCQISHSKRKVQTLSLYHMPVDNDPTSGYCACSLCSFTCNSCDVMSAHLKDTHSQIVTFCSVCRQGLNTQEAAGVHEYFCSGGRLYACIRCQMQYVGDLESARKHEETVHASTKNIDRRLFRELVRSSEEILQDGSRVQRCFQCGVSGCQQRSRQVKCMYCTAIVANNMEHMLEHPFTPATSIWPVSCRYQTGKGSQKVVPVAANKYFSDESHTRTYMKCLICDQVESTVQKMVAHVKKRHSKFSRQCQYCDTVFSHYETWRDHDHFCGGGDLLICNICGALCGGLKVLNDHICRNHPEEKGLKSTKTAKSTHKDSVVAARQQLCFVCGEQGCGEEEVKCIYCCKNVANIPDHMLEHAFTPAKSNWPVTCSINEDDADTTVLLATKAGQGKTTKLKCTLCGYMASGYKELATHLDSKHEVCEQLETCKHCDSVLRNGDEFIDHEHYCGGGRLLTCDVCSTICGGVKSLREHMENHHTDSKNEAKVFEDLTSRLAGEPVFDRERKQRCYACEGICTNAPTPDGVLKCLLCFRLVANSMDHMEEMHSFSLPAADWLVSCKHIRQNTSNENDFVVNKIYTDNISVKLDCLLCHFKTDESSVEEMQEHFRHKHKCTVFFCRHCSQGFRKPLLHKDHERFCAGLGFPSCQQCGRRFKSYSTLLTHQQKHDEQRNLNEENLKRLGDSLGGRIRRKHSKMVNFDPDKAVPDESGMVMICATCGTDCTAHRVRCLLCFLVVNTESSNHFLQLHENSPAKHWLVNCQDVAECEDDQSARLQEVFLMGQVKSFAYLLESLTEIPKQQVPLNIKCLLPHDEQTSLVLENMDAYTQHVSLDHDLQSLLLQLQYCEQCHLLFSIHNVDNRNRLKDHTRFCAGEGFYKCAVCAQFFATEQLMQQHERLKHHEPRLKMSERVSILVPKGSFIECQNCDFKAADFALYREHMTCEHRYKKTQVQVCRYCLMTFNRRMARELHEQVEHCGGWRHKCDHCPKMFDTQTQLRCHTKYYHEGGRIKQKLYRDNKPKIPCSYCGKLFGLSIHVRAHERTMHMHQRPYQCRICGQRFANHSACRTHEDRHTGFKRYKCPHCDYRAFKGSRVNEHIKIKHPGNVRAYGKNYVHVGRSVMGKDRKITINGKFTYKPRIKSLVFDSVASSSVDVHASSQNMEDSIVSQNTDVSFTALPQVDEQVMEETIAPGYILRQDNDANWITVYMPESDLQNSQRESLKDRESSMLAVSQTLNVETGEYTERSLETIAISPHISIASDLQLSVATEASDTPLQQYNLVPGSTHEELVVTQDLTEVADQREAGSSNRSVLKPYLAPIAGTSLVTFPITPVLAVSRAALTGAPVASQGSQQKKQVFYIVKN